MKNLFKGKRNSAKGKTFMVLSWTRDRYLSAAAIHKSTGVDLDYLQQRLTMWHKWGYLGRRALIPGKGRPLFCYCLSPKGKRYVEYTIPPDTYEKYLDEISEWGGKRVRELIKQRQPLVIPS